MRKKYNLNLKQNQLRKTKKKYRYQDLSLQQWNYPLKNYSRHMKQMKSPLMQRPAKSSPPTSRAMSAR